MGGSAQWWVRAWWVGPVVGPWLGGCWVLILFWRDACAVLGVTVDKGRPVGRGAAGNK